MSKKIIKINSGDYFELVTDVSIKNDYPYFLKTEDAIYFAVMYPNQPFHEALLLKGYTQEDQKKDGSIIITLTPEETRLSPGVYYYSIKLQCGGSLEDFGMAIQPKKVYTIIDRTKLIINE